MASGVPRTAGGWRIAAVDGWTGGIGSWRTDGVRLSGAFFASRMPRDVAAGRGGKLGTAS